MLWSNIGRPYRRRHHHCRRRCRRPLPPTLPPPLPTPLRPPPPPLRPPLPPQLPPQLPPPLQPPVEFRFQAVAFTFTSWIPKRIEAKYIRQVIFVQCSCFFINSIIVVVYTHRDLPEKLKNFHRKISPLPPSPGFQSAYTNAKNLSFGFLI